MKTKAHSAAQEISTLIPPFRPPGMLTQTWTSQDASPHPPQQFGRFRGKKSIVGEIDLLAAFRKERRAGAL